MEQIRKVVFFDIDGTLLAPETENRLSEGTLLAIQKLQRAGHFAVVNTGRTAAFMEKCILEAGFDAMIYGCGTMITLQGKELFHASLEKKVTDRLICLLRECRIDGVLEGKEKCCFDYRGTIRDPEFRKMSQDVSYVRGSFEEAESVDKLYIRVGADSDFDRFYREFSPLFPFIDRGNGFYELVPSGYSKATGMEYLLHYLEQNRGEKNGGHFSMEHTYAIGDSTNDLPMLQAAGVSIAMGNSMPELFDRVTHITKRIEEEGILYAIEKFVLE